VAFDSPLGNESGNFSAGNRAFYGDDPLRYGGGILPAMQEGSAFSGSKATSQKVSGGSVHGFTSKKLGGKSAIRRASAEKEARRIGLLST
jgi:hypothetical protein